MNSGFRFLIFLIIVCSACFSERLGAQAPADTDERIVVQKDISYLKTEPSDSYAKELCRLDLYLPKNPKEPFPLMVWFHGGALKGGSRISGGSVALAKSLAARGVGVALADYRLSPKVKFPEYVTDSAEAVRWAVENAERLNAKPGIFVGGHSAGGYLAAILAMDGKYLKDAGVKPEQIAGCIPMSGQMMTHYTVGAERGLSTKVIVADDAAPINHLRKDAPPLLVLVGDNDWPARMEDNAFFVAALRRIAENPNVSFFTIKDRTHGGILKHTAEDNDPAAVAILEFTKTGKLPSDGYVPPQAPAPDASAVQ